ncbi:MAG: IPT/TIG domain-containing protein, partial [Vicinamibacteraceae bacterium]
MMRANSFRSLWLAGLATLFGVLAFAGAASAQSVTLAWDANSESNISGYHVQYGTVAGNPSTTVDVGNVTQRQFAGLQFGVTYYFRVTAIDSSNVESPPSAEVSYTPVAPGGPTLTSIAPTSGPMSGGTVITLNGTNLASGATVTVNGVAATAVTFLSAAQVRATTPAGTAGARTVVITMPGGQTASLASAFTYIAPPPPPTVTSASPTSGPTAGGTTITVTGAAFVSGATVRVNGVAATGVTFLSATQVRAVTPAGTAGAQSVQVTNPDSQSATRAGAFTYTAPVPSPTLTSIAPATGATAGGTAVTLTGTNFAAGTTVTIGGAAATSVVVSSSTRITAVTPAGAAGARDVRVALTGGQSATLTGGFTYTAPTMPTLTSLSPVSGPTAGGTAVALTGTNFAAGTTVSIGGTAAASVVVVSSTRITAVAPAGTAGARDVRVTLSSGQATTLTGGFTYTTGTSTDSDGDGLTNEWETLYGLDPNSA